MMLRWIVGIFAAAFTAYTVFYTLQSNLTVGLVMLYLISLVLLGITVFYPVLCRVLHTGWGRAVGILLLAGCSVFLCTALFIGSLTGVTKPTGKEQVLIVLGGGLKGETVSSTLRYRLDAAYQYCLQYPEVQVVVTGGQGRGEDIPEAVAMKRYLVQKGISAERILAETASTSTLENFVFSRRMLQQNGFEKVDHVVVVTNRFHCYRAALIARREGIQASCVAAGISPTAFLPCYLREVLAVWYYWVFPA